MMTTSLPQPSFTHISEKQRNVIVQMDEIQVKSDITYNGGKHIGFSWDPNHLLALMVSSLHRKWSPIVRIIPYSKTSAEILFPTLKSNVIFLDKYFVLKIIQ